ncbi:hypothetical protein V8D89_009642 [Ganoderma adspersum]
MSVWPEFPRFAPISLCAESQGSISTTVPAAASSSTTPGRTTSSNGSLSEEHRAASPSPSAIWVEDACMLYALRVPRQTACVSIPLRQNREGAYVAPVLADAPPSVLELRVDMDEFDFTRMPPQDWPALFGPSAWAVPRLTLLVHTRDVTNRHRMGCMLETFSEILPAFVSLTHLLVRFVPNHAHFLVDMDSWKVPAGKHALMPSESTSALRPRRARLFDGSATKYTAWA